MVQRKLDFELFATTFNRVQTKCNYVNKEIYAKQTNKITSRTYRAYRSRGLGPFKKDVQKITIHDFEAVSS